MNSCQQRLIPYDLVQKAGGVGSPAGTWLKRLGEIRGDSVLLCISSTSITFSFSKSFHRDVAAIVLQIWCISITTTLTAVWDSHTASPPPSSHRENERLIWLQEEAKRVRIRYPHANMYRAVLHTLQPAWAAWACAHAQTEPNAFSSDFRNTCPSKSGPSSQIKLWHNLYWHAELAMKESSFMPIYREAEYWPLR